MRNQHAHIFNKLFPCFILFIFILMSASVSHAESYAFITKWGSEGSGHGQFSYPIGVAVDSSGNVYVADASNDRIQKFNSTGGYLTQWGIGGSGNGQFSGPSSVAVDSSGNVYVVDYNNARIQKFYSNGTFITKWGSEGSGDGQFNGPFSVTVDSSGNVYVGELGNKRIQMFSSNGTFITKWGSEGSGDGQFSYPSGVAVDSSGNVYVADRMNNRTQKYNSTGGYLTQWGTGGSGDGQFYYPFSVTVDSSGNVYIADLQNNRIQMFSSNGTFITKWGSKGSGDGQFSSPSGVAVDSSGNVYVTDRMNNRIQKFAPSEELVLPTANFTSNVTSGYVPLSVQFNDSSTNAESWNWNFGDGTNSTEQNPMHIFSAVGNYTVNLIASNENGTNSTFVNITVLKATPVITWSNPADMVYGTALNNIQLNATASVNGSFVYTPKNGTVLGVGYHTLRADFTPTDAANYTNASKNVTANVSSATPVITWNNPADIVYGTALNGTQLNATASVNGSFVYTPATGIILDAGQHTLKADFTPTDAANYTNASKNVTINVSAQPVLPVANFSSNVTSGYAPLSVQFNDSSTNAESWNWDFGDGQNSTERNPVHTFSTTGNYTVNLTVSILNEKSSKTAIITVLEQPGLVANLYLSINTLESKHPGSSMNYTLYYQNFGNKTAHNVVLEDVLSSNVELISASDGGIYNSSTREVIWNIGSVASDEHGYRTLTVEIPLNVTTGTLISNNASISTSDPESTYDDNKINIQTLVAIPNLPPNVSVEPTIGDYDIPSVYWKDNITFSYHSCDSATGISININIDDGKPDIVGNLTGGPSDWNYTTSFYPRTGKATVNYTIYGCDESPVSFSIYIDPEGYIYDMDTGNRIAGASVWLQRPDRAGEWESVPTNQSIAQPDVNPLTTDENGMYQWDVLNGTYRVHVEATGYEPKNSYAVMVPPPVTDLHVGMVRISNANYSIFKSIIDPDPTGDCIINNAGDIVPYRIVVKNEGNVDLTNVTVSDTLILPLPKPTGDDTDPGVLNTGETWTYDANYTLTPKDVENGSINNNATVTCDQLPGKSSSVNTSVDQNADLSIYKSVIGIDEDGDNIINKAGDVINYQVAVKNNGNIDLTNVSVSDPMVDLTKRTGDHDDSGVLNPGETWVYAGNYTVTQEDIDGAKVGNDMIKNTATVSCNQLSNESSSLELPIIYIPPNLSTSESENSTGLPVVNFSTNVTSGYAPLSVQFTDLSQNAISRSWDFNNDGSIDSTDTNPVYTYTTSGTYTANLTASNANGSSSKLATITVLQKTNSYNNGGSSGSTSGGSNGASIGKASVVSSISTTTTTSASPNATQTETTTSSAVQSSTPAKAESTPIQTAIENPAKEGKKTPGFETILGVTGLLITYLYRKK